MAALPVEPKGLQPPLVRLFGDELLEEPGLPRHDLGLLAEIPRHELGCFVAQAQDLFLVTYLPDRSRPLSLGS